eukprot:gene5859-6150_t
MAFFPKSNIGKLSYGIIIAVILLVVYSTWELQEASITHTKDFDGGEGYFGAVRNVSQIKEILVETNSNLHADLESGSGKQGVGGGLPEDTPSKAVEHIAALAPPPAARKKELKTNAYKINTCWAYPNLDFSGVAVKYGWEHKKQTAGECCDACQAYKPANDDALDCNVWVWCGDKELCKDTYQQCWLKHLAHLQVASPLGSGPQIGWTVGTMDTMDLRESFAESVRSAENIVALKFEREPTPKPFHTITSFQGRGVEWSMRTHYYHYKKMRAQCRQQLGPNCEMGGFTRLLHSGAPDQLMDEIPTIVVDPLSESVVPHRSYVVLNRPFAFVEWIKIVQVPEKYIFMSEPDHIIIHPLPNFMKGDVPAAFPFFYVVATDPKSVPHVKRYSSYELVKGDSN